MNKLKTFCGILVLISVSSLVSGGHHGIVDDEIWSHVFKVLSDTEHGKKVIVGHPEPAHLVDAYTKVYHHEPFGYHGQYPHPLHHHHHHHLEPAPLVYHGHHRHHVAPHHVHAHPHHPVAVPLFHHGHGLPPPPPPPLHHHHAPEPVYRIPVPTVLNTYGPPHLHAPLRHHHHHKK